MNSCLQRSWTLFKLSAKVLAVSLSLLLISKVLNDTQVLLVDVSTQEIEEHNQELNFFYEKHTSSIYGQFNPSQVIKKPTRFKFSFFQNQQIHQQKQFLCHIGVKERCFSFHVAQYVGDLWVIAPIYSFYQSWQPMMYKNHGNFRYYMESLGVSFCTLEAIKKEKGQQYLVSRPNNEPYEIQLEITENMYQRENLVNVGLKYIEKAGLDWQYVAWIDAHQYFENSYWWEESMVHAEKESSVQLFHVVRRLNYNNETYLLCDGSIYKSLTQSVLEAGRQFYFGNAFILRKELYREIDYIADTCIASCCDCLYVYASIDPAEKKIQNLDRWPSYIRSFDLWTNKTRKAFKYKRKSIRGELAHFEHESFYDYFKFLYAVDGFGFDPDRDLQRTESMRLMIKNETLKELTENLQSFWVLNLIISILVIAVVSAVIFFFLIKYRIIKKEKLKLFNKRD